MKVTHVIPGLSVGGAQRFVADLLCALSGHSDLDLTLVVYRSVKDSPAERKIRDNARIRFVNLDLGKPRGLSTSFRLMSEMRRADIVHAHLFPTLWQAALSSALSGTPLVFTEHSTHNRRRNHRWLRLVEQTVYSSCMSVCAISPAAAEALRKWLGSPFDNRTIHVIPNGIDPGEFAEERPNDSLLPSIFGRSGKPVVMPARFVEAKDQATLIRAAALIDDPDAFIALAGDGPTRAECEKLAARYGLGDRIVFLGVRNDIPRLLAASRVGVLSSRWEGFGLAALEMMAAGLPVVASDVPGLREVVDGVGDLFPKGDEQTLARIINRLLRESPDSPSFVSRALNARERAEEFDISKAAGLYADLYRQDFILARK